MNVPAFKADSARKEILDRIRSLPTNSVKATDKLNGWPSVALEDILNDEVWEAFRSLASDIKAAIEAGETQNASPFATTKPSRLRRVNGIWPEAELKRCPLTRQLFNKDRPFSDQRRSPLQFDMLNRTFPGRDPKQSSRDQSSDYRDL